MILKETLIINDSVQHTQAGDVIHVAQQDPGSAYIQIWFDDKNIRERRFLIHGTGHPVEINEKYIGTSIDLINGFVWHVFEAL